jgi:hypothetical protein
MSEEKPMFSAKVWAYRKISGKEYFDVFLGDGAKAWIDFLEGVTTQQSFVALGRALEEKLGSCSITAMNKPALFDESDGLSEEQKLKLFKTLGNPLHGAKALNAISRVSVK